MITSVVFLSNYFNHHQKPFSDAMYDRLGDGYLFIETSSMSSERKQLGWGVAQKPMYVVSREIFRERYAVYMEIINRADAVIIGSAPNELVKDRIHAGRLTFRYSERPLKKGLELWKYPYRFLRWHHNNPQNRKLYMLCASAFTASDYAMFGLFKNRCYKWGYFPETKVYQDIDALIAKKKPASILWVGRLIDWKHPEAAIEIAKRLKADGHSFELNIIGNGVMEAQLKQRIAEEKLDDVVHMLGSMKPEEVRSYMEASGIFLFTSDKQEGWGAVLNEAMNSGCAVVANSAIGSAPYLIKNGENGLTCQNGNVEDLYEKVVYLLNHTDECNRIGREAYHTITEQWCAELASDRFVELAGRILSGEVRPNVADCGVCSIEQ